MDCTYGAKDLYSGMLLASKDITINGVEYKENDVILYFDNIQSITFQESKEDISARGGFNNRSLVNWSTTQEVQGIMEVGRISKMGYGLINSNIINNINSIKAIRQIEKHQVEDNIIVLRHTPDQNYNVKVMKLNQGSIVGKITEFEIKENTLVLKENDIDVLVDYYFSYNTKALSVKIGEKNLPGCLKFVGKFYYTDEQGSSRKTAIIEIPRIELNGTFEINFGRNASPIVSVLRFKAVPIGDRENTKTAEIIYLDEDIDGDL